MCYVFTVLQARTTNNNKTDSVFSCSDIIIIIGLISNVAVQCSDCTTDLNKARFTAHYITLPPGSSKYYYSPWHVLEVLAAVYNTERDQLWRHLKKDEAENGPFKTHFNTMSGLFPLCHIMEEQMLHCKSTSVPDYP